MEGRLGVDDRAGVDDGVCDREARSEVFSEPYENFPHDAQISQLHGQFQI